MFVRRIIPDETPPDDFVEQGEEEEEQAPAEGQLPPALFIELEGRVEDITQQGAAEQQAATAACATLLAPGVD